MDVGPELVVHHLYNFRVHFLEFWFLVTLQIDHECLGVSSLQLYPLLPRQVQLGEQAVVESPAELHLVVQFALAGFRGIQPEPVTQHDRSTPLSPHLQSRSGEKPSSDFRGEVGESIPAPQTTSSKLVEFFLN